jgi:hypothetical protein
MLHALAIVMLRGEYARTPGCWRYTGSAVDNQAGHSRAMFGAITDSPAFDATIRFATAMVQDGMSRVRVIVPREAGVLTHARRAARLAGVSVQAEHVGSATITIQFSSLQQRPVNANGSASDRDLHRGSRRRRRWSRILGWLVSARR